MHFGFGRYIRANTLMFFLIFQNIAKFKKNAYFAIFLEKVIISQTLLRDLGERTEIWDDKTLLRNLQKILISEMVRDRII